MKKILTSHDTSNKLEIYSEHLPQSLIVVGSNGMGKETVLRELAEKVAGPKWFHSTKILEPISDKKQISIDQIRELKGSLKLSTSKLRIILIPHAEKLTTEAQNSLLKMLEEPPTMTHFLLATPKISNLLITIQSRSIIWPLAKPSIEEIHNYFPTNSKLELDKAILVSERRPGMLVELVDEGIGHDLIVSLDTAKEILSLNEFSRMCLVNNITKDPTSLNNLLNALEIVCRSALHNVVDKEDQKSTKAWQKRLKYVETAISQLDKNIQTKLVISKLFLML